MTRAWIALPATLLTGAALAGCGAARSAPAMAASHHPAHARSASPEKPGQLATARPLQGKFEAIALAFPTLRTGIGAVFGYPAQGTTIRSWIERTNDGGAHWAASPPGSGQGQPGTQAAMAFGSAREGWAYLPNLFFTLDGGATWRAEHTPFALTGPLAIAGHTTWVVGYGCRRGACPAVIYTTSRIGGKLRRLPRQPPIRGDILTMLRPSQSVAWLVLASRRGRPALVTTRNAGRSWSTLPLPCPSGTATRQLSAASPNSLWLVCTAAGMSLPGLLYRTTNGGRTWRRIGVENALSPDAISNRIAWGVQNGPAGSALVRTVNGGRTWRTILRRANTEFDAFVATGPENAYAIGRVFSDKSIFFIVYRTDDGGAHWLRSTLGP